MVGGRHAPSLAMDCNTLLQPQVIGYKKNPTLHADWVCVDLEKKSK